MVSKIRADHDSQWAAMSCRGASTGALTHRAQASENEVPHTWCIPGLVSSGESASSSPSWPLVRATQAGELVGDAAPLGVRELVPGFSVGERFQHASAGAGGVEHRADVRVETGRFLDVGDR
jgi:hypothetical protein